MDWNWILDHKEWLFSGIGIIVPLTLIGWWFQKRSNKQVVKKVNDSVIVQEHDINIKTDK